MHNSTQKWKKSEISFSFAKKRWRFLAEILGSERCKGMILPKDAHAHLVDLVKSFPTSIYLQKSTSIQPITSLSKVWRWFDSFVHSPPQYWQQRLHVQFLPAPFMAAATISQTVTTFSLLKRSHRVVDGSRSLQTRCRMQRRRLRGIAFNLRSEIHDEFAIVQVRPANDALVGPPSTARNRNWLHSLSKN